MNALSTCNPNWSTCVGCDLDVAVGVDVVGGVVGIGIAVACGLGVTAAPRRLNKGPSTNIHSKWGVQFMHALNTSL